MKRRLIVGDDLGFEIVKTDGIGTTGSTRAGSSAKEAKKRPPVVVIMGHVDHGKTTLLDKILSTNVAAGESGGITQNVSAYQVKKKANSSLLWIRPGHEAFHSMRERGAYITDLAVIVVAADDGVKPQTKEAVEFAKNAGLPILVAINKIDKPEANIEKVKKELSEIDLLPEEWGGKTVCVNITAKTGEGIDELLDMIILYADMEDLKAEYDAPAEGFIIESHLNPKVGPDGDCAHPERNASRGRFRGCGHDVRKGESHAEISSESRSACARPRCRSPSWVFNEVPRAGLVIKAYANRQRSGRSGAAVRRLGNTPPGTGKIISASKIKEMAENGKLKKLNLIIKADTKGSLEAIVQILEAIKVEGLAIADPQDRCGKYHRVGYQIGAVFGRENHRFQQCYRCQCASKFAEKEEVGSRIFNIIYELATYVKEELSAH